MFNLFINSINYNNIREDLISKNLSHAYLFLSKDKLTNSLFATSISQLILCDNKNNCGKCPSCLKAYANSHPDILTYPKSKTFIVDDANDLIKHILEKPMLNEKKVIIINNIDEATIQAQNKILKTLEEPPASTVFLLTAKNENKILPTVISRTRKILLSSIPFDLIKKYLIKTDKFQSNELLDEAINYGGGWVGKTLEALNNEDFMSEKKLADEIVKSFSSSKSISVFSFKVLEFKRNLKEFLELLSVEFFKEINVDNQQKTEGIIKIIKEINLANQNLERNVNQNLIVDNLLMKILEIKYYHQI